MLSFKSILPEYSSVCNYLQFVYFGRIFHVLTNDLFLCQSICKLDLNKMANYVTWKKRMCRGFRTGTPSLQITSGLCLLKTVKGFSNGAVLDRKKAEPKEPKALSKTIQRHWWLNSPSPCCLPGPSYTVRQQEVMQRNCRLPVKEV